MIKYGSVWPIVEEGVRPCDEGFCSPGPYTVSYP